MGIKDLYKFPFPTPPEKIKLHNSICHLNRLKALEKYKEDQNNNYTDTSFIT